MPSGNSPTVHINDIELSKLVSLKFAGLNPEALPCYPTAIMKNPEGKLEMMDLWAARSNLQGGKYHGYEMPHLQLALHAIERAELKNQVIGRTLDIGVKAGLAVGFLTFISTIVIAAQKLGSLAGNSLRDLELAAAQPLAGQSGYKVSEDKNTIYYQAPGSKVTYEWNYASTGELEKACAVTERDVSFSLTSGREFSRWVVGKYVEECQTNVMNAAVLVNQAEQASKLRRLSAPKAP